MISSLLNTSYYLSISPGLSHFLLALSIFLSFDWLLSLSLSISHSLVSPTLPLLFSPPLLVGSFCIVFSLSCFCFYLHCFPFFFFSFLPISQTEEGIYFHPLPGAISQSASQSASLSGRVSICLIVTQPASQSLCTSVKTLIKSLIHKARQWSRLISTIQAFCLRLFLTLPSFLSLLSSLFIPSQPLSGFCLFLSPLSLSTKRLVW